MTEAKLRKAGLLPPVFNPDTDDEPDLFTEYDLKEFELNIFEED